jgi:hypothetical protein
MQHGRGVGHHAVGPVADAVDLDPALAAAGIAFEHAAQLVHRDATNALLKERLAERGAKIAELESSATDESWPRWAPDPAFFQRT